MMGPLLAEIPKEWPGALGMRVHLPPYLVIHADRDTGHREEDILGTERTGSEPLASRSCLVRSVAVGRVRIRHPARRSWMTKYPTIGTTRIAMNSIKYGRMTRQP